MKAIPEGMANFPPLRLTVGVGVPAMKAIPEGMANHRQPFPGLVVQTVAAMKAIPEGMANDGDLQPGRPLLAAAMKAIPEGMANVSDESYDTGYVTWLQ